MGGMTPAGRIYTLARQESLNGSHSVEFLVHLMRVASERLLVIWDGSPIHGSTERSPKSAEPWFGSLCPRLAARCGWSPCQATPPI
jgi:hypothetical protein